MKMTNTMSIEQESSKNYRQLIFYNRPGKTASTTVRIAMRRALREKGMTAAKCFNRLEWNQMAFRSIINRRLVHFYGCHTILTNRRYREIQAMRSGNVIFMTSTRHPERVMLSSYMQDTWHRNVVAIRNVTEMKQEMERYENYITNYNVGGLYSFHVTDTPLLSCPYKYTHLLAMRRAAERYEIVVDMQRPEESAVIVEIVTGLKPNFSIRFNEKTTSSTPMLKVLERIDTSHKNCGNELAHRVLIEQFNLIKDRIMQDRCFDEETASSAICDRILLTVGRSTERSRVESYAEKERIASATREAYPIIR